MNTATEKDRTNSSAFRAKNPALEEAATTQMPGDQMASGNLDKKDPRYSVRRADTGL